MACAVAVAAAAAAVAGPRTPDRCRQGEAAAVAADRFLSCSQAQNLLDTSDCPTTAAVAAAAAAAAAAGE